MRTFVFFFFILMSFSLKGFAQEQSISYPQSLTKLSQEEINTDWAKEYRIGLFFAKAQDYQNAITTFKRALILSSENSSRRIEIEYAILLSYYLDHQYREGIQFFETHSLLYATPSFKAYHDLMIILSHCYEITKEHKKADLILKRIEEISNIEAMQMKLTGAIIRRDIGAIEKASEKTPYQNLIKTLTENFLKKKKSEKLAKWMNVFVPGLGYFYLGQKKTALTSFLINVLLIGGAVQLFVNHYYTLGSLTALLEIGWYAGGIFGAKHSTYLYNETLFTNYAEKIFYHESLSPESKLQYEF